MTIACDVCGKEIDEKVALRVVLEEEEVLVCSRECRDEALRTGAVEDVLPSLTERDRP